MKIYSPLYIVIRIVAYSLLIFGAAEAIFFDAAHPMEEGYFGELTFTEIGQEIILFVLFVFFLRIGFLWKQIQPVVNLVSLFLLMSFIREFNFISNYWIYPVLVVAGLFVWLVIRDFRKIKASAISFFSVPASAWLMSGILITYIFSRLLGRSKFWQLLYHDESYRLAKAATEEGLELLGNTLMLIGAIEFLLYYYFEVRIRNTESNKKD